MKRKAFVTGATGFVGFNLIKQLFNDGWEIYALHRASSNRDYLRPLFIHMVEGSLDDRDSLMHTIPENIDVIFHVAGNTSTWSRNNEEQYNDNVIGTRNMVDCALEKRAGRFVYTSSIAAYGIHKTKVNESTISNAETCGINYNKTKYLAEQEVKNAASKGLSTVILNPAHIIGAFDQTGWAQLIQAVYRNKLPGIPSGSGMFCHVKDVVKAHLTAVDKGKDGENYLLGGEEASFLDVINKVKLMLGRPTVDNITPDWVLGLGSYLYKFTSLFASEEPPITPEKLELVTGYIACDYSKAAAELGYNPKPLDDMLKDSYNWLSKTELL